MDKPGRSRSTTLNITVRKVEKGVMNNGQTRVAIGSSQTEDGQVLREQKMDRRWVAETLMTSLVKNLKKEKLRLNGD